MSALVLIVGALMVAAGAYQMYVGSGDILSERGWSAFIAGAVLLAGGIVTSALGILVRAIDGLRSAVLRQHAGLVPVPSHERVEPDAELVTAEHEAPRGPSFEEASTAPLLAEVPSAAVMFEPQAALVETAPLPEMRQQREPSVGAEPPHEDWLDHSFAELEREMTATPSAVEPAHREALQDAPAHHAAPAPSEPARGQFVESSAAVIDEPTAPEPHTPFPESVAHEPAPEGATVSARETSPPPGSAVIGRYESEGTSYVMYADGSIDAQSEAGVYRFASMSELKAFIES